MTFEKWIEDYPNLNDFERDLAKKAFTEGKNSTDESLKKENEDLRNLCHEKDINNDDLVRRLTDFSDKYYILLEICSSLQGDKRRMDKEELEKEAEVYSYKLYHSKAWNPGEDMLAKAYLAGAEPRERRIQELEAQIEKMKRNL